MTAKTVKKAAAPKKPVKATSKTPAKKATPKKTPADKPEELDLKIVSTSKCPTISGKSNLTYNVGIDDEGHFFIRILSNDGGGFFSKEWVSMDAVKALLSGIPVDHEISSLHLVPLFKGKSVNTPGYLLAALFNEKMLTLIPGMKRKFAYTGKEAPTPKVTKRKTTKKSK